MSGTAHKLLATRCEPWLHGRVTGRGIKGGFEVPLRNGYVADWVGLCGFQERFLRQYVKSQTMFRNADGMLVRLDPEFACVFEVKAFRGDFLSTFGPTSYPGSERAYPAGALHWVVAPMGQVRIEEVPDFWGLLLVSGGGLREVKPAKYCPISDPNRHAIGYSLLWYGKDEPG